jgi:drug/metabolite transporter (DMT)-like permease
MECGVIWLPPLLAVWFFAASAICGQRLTTMMDAMWANLTRLTLAAVFLAILTFVFAEGLQLGNAAMPWFVLSGAVGFGIGDIGLYLAFVRLGARLTLLINLCLAPLFAAAGERLLLGTRIGGPEFAAMLMVLLGVGLSVTGRRPVQPNRERDYPLGIALAVLAGMGQGFGAVLSRWAEMHAAPGPVGPFAQAFQRCGAGWLVLLLATLVWTRFMRRRNETITRVPFRKLFPWLLGAATFGPVIGVSCFQWGLVLVQNSAFVQAVVSTSPIALMILVYLIDREAPTRRSVIGAIVGIAGVAALCLRALRATKI